MSYDEWKKAASRNFVGTTMRKTPWWLQYFFKKPPYRRWFVSSLKCYSSRQNPEDFWDGYWEYYKEVSS